MGTRISEVDSILFIRSAERSHSGKYTLSVQIENMCDSADINIQVVGESPPPLAQWEGLCPSFKQDAASSFHGFSSPRRRAASHQSLAAANPAPSSSSRRSVRAGGSGCQVHGLPGIISTYGCD